MSKLAANTALVLAAAQAAVVLVAAFGVSISGTQRDAIGGFLAALLAVVGVLFHPSIPPPRKP